jgi:hypothetical protein
MSKSRVGCVDGNEGNRPVVEWFSRDRRHQKVKEVAFGGIDDEPAIDGERSVGGSRTGERERGAKRERERECVYVCV